MDGTWNVYFENRAVGTCTLRREGLYIRIVCSCDRVVNGICRLMMQCSDGSADLGILIPVDSGLGLDRKLSSKALPQGEPRFTVRIPDKQSKEIFVPVKDGESFACLAGLAEARFGKQGGETGVFIKKRH